MAPNLPPGRDADATPAGPLAGTRIADCSTVLAGPFATMLLADLGGTLAGNRGSMAQSAN